MTSETAAELDLYQEVVMDHKRAPRHFGPLAAPTDLMDTHRAPSVHGQALRAGEH